MKYLLILCFVALCVYQLPSTEAAAVSSRFKRAVGEQFCPENTTLEQCKIVQTEEYKKNHACIEVTYVYANTDGKLIYGLAGCGNTECTWKGQTLNVTQDFSKDYPECCPKCDLSGLPPGARRELQISATGK